MTKCYYCDYEYESDTEFHKHLNQKHFRCAFCGQVFDWKDGMVGAICDKCSEEHDDESR